MSALIAEGAARRSRCRSQRQLGRSTPHAVPPRRRSRRSARCAWHRPAGQGPVEVRRPPRQRGAQRAEVASVRSVPTAPEAAPAGTRSIDCRPSSRERVDEERRPGASRGRRAQTKRGRGGRTPSARPYLVCRRPTLALAPRWRRSRRVRASRGAAASRRTSIRDGQTSAASSASRLPARRRSAVWSWRLSAPSSAVCTARRAVGEPTEIVGVGLGRHSRPRGSTCGGHVVPAHGWRGGRMPAARARSMTRPARRATRPAQRPRRPRRSRPRRPQISGRCGPATSLAASPSAAAPRPASRGAGPAARRARRPADRVRHAPAYTGRCRRRRRGPSSCQVDVAPVGDAVGTP